MITIVLADDHQMVRKAFKLLLEIESGLKVVGETGDGLGAVELVERLKPNVLLLDLMIPRLHGLDVIRALRVRHETKILVVSMCADESHVIEALRNGAAGYVLKDSSATELIEGVRATANGDLFVSQKLKNVTLSAGLRKASGPRDGSNLTDRETLVLQMAAGGTNSRMIAAQLSLSPRTVESHRGSLMKKLGLKTQTDLVRYAIRRKIISS